MSPSSDWLVSQCTSGSLSMKRIRELYGLRERRNKKEAEISGTMAVKMMSQLLAKKKKKFTFRQAAGGISTQFGA